MIRYADFYIRLEYCKILKNKDRIFISVILGMPLGLTGMAGGFLLASIYNKFLGSGIFGKKTKRFKRKIKQ